MGHADINLTMSLYTHVFRGQESQAVAKLPDLSLPSREKQQAVAIGTNDGKNLVQNLALLDGKPRISMDSDGQKLKKQVYSGKLKKLLFKVKNAVFAAKKQAQKK